MLFSYDAHDENDDNNVDGVARSVNNFVRLGKFMRNQSIIKNLKFFSDFNSEVRAAIKHEQR